jgi:outer membrane protein assembly factor BamB
MKRVILSLVAGSLAAAGAWAAGRPPDDRPAWPQANGPFGNFNPRKYGVKLLDDISQAKLVWTSEENDLGYGKRSGDDSLYRWLGHPGAANSSLAAEGNLFVSSYRPAGDVWSKGNPYDGWFDKIPAEHQERFRSNFRIEADDFTVAIDMASGKTVWKTVEECKGMNRHMPKRGGWCVSPAYHDGRVFSMGTTGRLYGYEAATGKKLWESDIGKGHQTWEAQKAKIIEEARNDRPARLAKDRCQVSLIGADGVLIVPLYDGPDMGLGGVDGRTGKVMWQVPAATARTATPALWCHEGRQYVLAATCGDANRRTAKLRLIDPRTGKVLWTVDGLCNTHFSLAPSDKHVLVNVGSKTPGHGGIPWMLLGCYRLSLDGAKLVWTMPDELEFWHEGTYESSDWRKYLIHDGKVYYYSRARNPDQSMVFGFFIFDEQTGRILYRKRAPQGGDDAPVPGQHYFIEDRLLQVPDASHGDRLTLRLWTTDPKDLRPLCPPWNPPHIATTAYEVFMEFPYVDGRIFMRTKEGAVVCYDLRAAAR